MHIKHLFVVARFTFGATLVLGGLIGVSTGIFALIDPVGAQMTDDADPFGSPLGSGESLMIILAFAIVGMAGWWLCLRGNKGQHDS